MKTLPSPFQPTKTAADCHDWLTAEDVIGAALAAFHANCRYVERSAATYGESGIGPDGRRTFADDLAEIFEAKLHDQGFRRKVPGFHGWASDTPAWWTDDTLTATRVTPLDIHRRASHNGND